MYILKWNTPR